MPYVPFHDYFPEIAEKETRAIIVFDDTELPRGDYGLVEMFCDEPGCDCRRVFFTVFSSVTEQPEAVIAYGWENKKFYKKWYGHNDPQVINGLKGPILNDASPQSKLAPALLSHVTYVLQDKNYVNRIKRHYKIFREEIEKRAVEGEHSELKTRLQVGRNDPCPCGSGKKYKKCCFT